MSCRIHSIMQTTMCDADCHERFNCQTSLALVCTALHWVMQAVFCHTVSRFYHAVFLESHKLTFAMQTYRWCSHFSLFEWRVYGHARSRAWQPLSWKVSVTGCSLVSTPSLAWHHASSTVSPRLPYSYWRWWLLVLHSLQCGLSAVWQGSSWSHASCKTLLGFSKALRRESLYYALVFFMDLCWV